MPYNAASTRPIPAPGSQALLVRGTVASGKSVRSAPDFLDAGKNMNRRCLAAPCSRFPVTDRSVHRA